MALNQRQTEAVYNDGRELLISASAGTGKTSTMCARIVHRVTREKDPLSLDRMLIVTFTVASAADMRKKLAQTLRDALKNETDAGRKERIRAQIALLPGARICTIDSFCSDLVRRHFDRLGISPRQRIPDGSELKRIKSRCMRSAMNACRSEDKEGFSELINSILTGYSDKELPETLFRWYERFDGGEKGIAVLSELAEKCEAESALPFGMTRAGKYITAHNQRTVSFFIDTFTRYLALLGETRFEEKKNENLRQRHMDLCEARLDDARAVRQSLGDPGALAALCAELQKKRYTVNALPCALFDQFRYAHELFKDFCKDRAEACLNFDFAGRAYALKKEAALLRMLHCLFGLYEAELEARKKSLGIAEFSDIERRTLQLLYVNGRNGEITDLARQIGREFDEIYVDEYQDVNAMQNSIFKALSCGNRFMVGDIKQSIYGFRGACPDAFNALRESYPPLEEDKPKAKIFFAENYRCAKPVVDLVNASCARLLRLCTDMHYYDEDDLICGKSTEGNELSPALCILTPDQNLFERDSVENVEAAYVAKCVKAMIDKGTPAEDITVLSRTMNGAPALRRAFDKVGVPLDLTTHKGFFDHPEVIVLRSILEMINDPTSDIFLAGAMKSPVFGFTLDDLIAIRQASGEESLYSALLSYAETRNDPRAAALLGFIASYRRRSKEWTVDRLVYSIMRECSLTARLTLGMSAGKAQEIRDNLFYFYDLIRALSSDGACDIGRVLSRIADMAAAGEAGEGKMTLPVIGHVRMMTIHGSKGLQFKVCWLYDTAGKIEKSNEGPAVSEEFGVSFRIRDEKYPFIRQKSENGVANDLLRREKSLNEYLRLLYVALTRTIDRLYISAKVTKKQCEILDILKNASGDLYTLADRNRDGLSLLLLGVGDGKGLCRQYVDRFLPELPEEETREEKKSADPEKAAIYKKIYERRLGYVYPRSALCDLPAKKAASVLYPAMLDEDGEDYGEEVPDGTDDAAEQTAYKPLFIRRREGETQLHGAAERGSATHAFMQFCDFDHLEKNGFEAESARLLEKGYLDAPTLAMVDGFAVRRFLHSDLYGSIKKAKRFWREQRFMITLPAGDFTSDPAKKEELAGEELLVQGVIDGFFEDEDGKIVLFDYKTDRFTRQQLSDRNACAEILRQRHARQLSYYKEAVQRMLSRRVDRCLIYSFALGEEVGIP